tara:strand:- start:374 stop:760 length:387 start_codon:yes stop_codon:yes gene_type:complete
MKEKIVSFFIVGLLFVPGCTNKHFIIYKMDGERYSTKSRMFNTSPMHDFKLFFNKSEINKDYDEVAIFATDNFYYGQFFLDDIFMKILKVKALEVNADAIIYEKDRNDFPEYNEKFLYFTAIRYKFNN